MLNKLEKLLSANTYPGRGIVIGRSEDGKRAVTAYFIMGRTENSRNRIFCETEDGIRTKAFEPAKMSDPSLVIYHPVRVIGGRTIITNGDQTDTIRDFISAGKDFRDALLTREFEPDPPNYTPRISGIIERGGGYRLSILKSADGNPACCVRHFFEYEAPIQGTGHFISTYVCDGNPLPSFAGEPIAVEIDVSDGLEQFAQRIWNALNTDNKVSLYVSEIDLLTGNAEHLIINKNV